MPKRQHIATYGEYNGSGKRIATCYLYTVDDIRKAERDHWNANIPFRMRWRNDECRIAAAKEMAGEMTR